MQDQKRENRAVSNGNAGIGTEVAGEGPDRTGQRREQNLG